MTVSAWPVGSRPSKSYCLAVPPRFRMQRRSNLPTVSFVEPSARKLSTIRQCVVALHDFFLILISNVRRVQISQNQGFPWICDSSPPFPTLILSQLLRSIARWPTSSPPYPSGPLACPGSARASSPVFNGARAGELVFVMLGFRFLEPCSSSSLFRPGDWLEIAVLRPWRPGSSLIEGYQRGSSPPGFVGRVAPNLQGQAHGLWGDSARFVALEMVG